MTPFLKVKIKSLAAEAAIIRNMERKFKKPRYRGTQKTVMEGGTVVYTKVGNPKFKPLPYSLDACKGDPKEIDRFNAFWGLRRHRVQDVRREARHSLIAYGFIRGTPFKLIEDHSYTKPDWKRILEIIKKFGDREISKERLEAWAAGDNQKLN